MGQARSFLRNVSKDMKKGDRLLLGMDLIKSEEVLHAAYNDRLGVTEAFNLNILSSVNEILLSDFREEDFLHVAFFNREKSRIEMHLEAIRDIQVSSPYLNEPVFLRKGERIHTENSHKYCQKHILDFASYSGLNVHKIHTDNREWFALVEFVKP
jgi:L-histidine N-alpha-methyltransferase